jgi:hypothetical protein
MKTKEIQLDNKKLLIKELLYLDVVGLTSITDKKENTIKLLELSGLTSEDIKDLTAKDGLAIIQAVNELNGFNVNVSSDFT